MTDPEHETVALAQAGDEGAFAMLFNQNYHRIHRLAFHITHNQQDAEDVLQNAFLKAFTHLEQFRSESRFSTWLTRIAVNEALALRRRGGPTQVSMDGAAESSGEPSASREVEDVKDDAEERYSKVEMHAILSEIVQKLEPPLRHVFILRYVQEVSTEGTAKLLGLSVSAVKSRLLRARLKMRGRLTQVVDQNSGMTPNLNVPVGAAQPPIRRCVA